MKDIILKLNKILKLIKDLFKINPHKHWIFIIYVFFILISVLILFSFYLLYKIKNEQIFQTELKQDSVQSLLNEKLLKKVIDFQDKKAQKIIDSTNNNSIYKDPSI